LSKLLNSCTLGGLPVSLWLCHHCAIIVLYVNAVAWLQDAPSAQHLPDYAADGQQRILSHAAVEPDVNSCLAAQNGQPQQQLVQEQPQQQTDQHALEQQQQPVPMQTELQLPPLAQPPSGQLTQGNSGSLQEHEVQQLLRFSSGGSMSSGAPSGVHTRQPSMLSDSGRASRRTSLMRGDSFSDSPVPPIVHQVWARSVLAFNPLFAAVAASCMVASASAQLTHVFDCCCVHTASSYAWHVGVALTVAEHNLVLHIRLPHRVWQHPAQSSSCS
jgi:hypothetical protein